jgi:hypothetical protein
MAALPLRPVGDADIDAGLVLFGRDLDMIRVHASGAAGILRIM